MAMSGDMFYFHDRELLLVFSCVKPGVLLTSPCTGQVPTTKNYLAQNISSAGSEKHWARESGRWGEGWTLQIGFWAGIHFKKA